MNYLSILDCSVEIRTIDPNYRQKLSYVKPVLYDRKTYIVFGDDYMNEYKFIPVGQDWDHGKSKRAEALLNQHVAENWQLWGFREGYAILERKYLLPVNWPVTDVANAEIVYTGKPCDCLQGEQCVERCTT